MTKSKNSFSSKYEELKEIVSWFDEKEVDLELGLKKFESGMKIVKELQEYLSKMENKIKELKNLNI